MDLRLENGAIIQIVGPSGSGKSHFTCQLLETRYIFKNPIQKIYWHQGIEQDESGDTNHLFKKLKNCKIIKGFDKGWMRRPKKHDVIVIDDFLVKQTVRKGLMFYLQKLRDTQK